VVASSTRASPTVFGSDAFSHARIFAFPVSVLDMCGGTCTGLVPFTRPARICSTSGRMVSGVAEEPNSMP